MSKRRNDPRENVVVAAPAAETASGSWSRWSSLPLAAKIAVCVLGMVQLPLLVLAFNRVFIDFDIDSGAYFMMHVIERVRTGLPVYLSTAPGQCSPSYPPLYLWIAGFLCKVLGPSMIWPRCISVFFTAVLGVVAGAFVWRRTEKNLLLSLAAPLFVISSYTYIGPWVFDIQINAMQTALVALGFFVLMSTLSTRRVILAAVVMSLAVLTKQTSLAYVVAAGVLVLFRAPKLSVVYGAVVAGILGVICLWLNHASNGYFLRNVIGAGEAPWLVDRLWNEVLFPDLLGRYGLMAAMLVIPLLAAGGRRFMDTALKPEYVMCAAGVAVACIAQPKYGSGATHAIVAYTGLSVCGCIGLYELSRALPARISPALVSWIVILQTIVLFLPVISVYPQWQVDDWDRGMYQQVTDVFRKGRTAYFYYPYLPTLFGQPDSGQYGDETMKWKNGRTDYSATPASVYAPITRQEYDYMILPVFLDQRDPAVQAVLANYTAVSRIPGHPRGPGGGNARYEKVVLKAKRLLPVSVGPTQSNVPGRQGIPDGY